MGAVLHTVNIRLSPEHIACILNHAESRFVLVDECLLPLLEKVKDRLVHVEGYIAQCRLGKTFRRPLYSLTIPMRT
ncbi:hypothetical protein [Paenibacillus mucilaginosus]|uniref:hypothetical protein n=1 Tax=Paenibacillus mucilaginosus TaxID=61624 RepID=UPI003D21EDBF